MVCCLQRLSVAGLALLALVVTVIAQTVTFSDVAPFGINDAQPKLRIRGTGFAGMNPDDVEVKFMPKLVSGIDFNVTFQEEAMVCSLNQNKRWAILDQNQPKILYLSSFKLKGGANLIEDPISVANVLPTPSVKESDKVIYMTATPRLMINGTNFNMKRTSLFFDPPLNEGTDFTMQIISETQILLIKKPERPWRTDPGPLKLLAINNGGGRLALAPSDDTSEYGGLLIAEVQADLEGHGITVETNKDLKLYQSHSTLAITGTGFRNIDDGGTLLRFSNGLRGAGVNYTTEAISPDQMVLKLTAGSKWRQNAASLPGPLVLLAANAGAGYIALGSTAAKAGRVVATVYEDPDVFASPEQEAFRTHTHSINVKGKGFNTEVTPKVQFLDSALERNKDYIVQVVDKTLLKLSLVTAWMPEGKSGELKISGIDTGAGMKTLASPVVICKVLDDAAPHESGAGVNPDNTQVIYQSEAIKRLKVCGSSLTADCELAFKPALTKGADYSQTLEGDCLFLTLKEGKKWATTSGDLVVSHMKTATADIELGGGSGVKVATILADPVVYAGELRIYAGHTKHFTIKGLGFVSAANQMVRPKVTLDITPAENYEVDEYQWQNSELLLVLKNGKWAEVTGDNTVVLHVIKLDTGAGEVDMKVAVAVVHADSDDIICEDSCEYANDMQCDEPRAQGSALSGYDWSYDDDANWFYDDDYADGYQYAGYSNSYAYYFGSDDMLYRGVAACEPGTDCTDCGITVVVNGTCENTCQWARDGHCDDPHGMGVCPLGTDCQDCGPVGHNNFSELNTAYDTTGWFSDDSNFLWDDDGLLIGQEANEHAMFKRNFKDHATRPINRHPESPGRIFMNVLWAVVILVGGSVSLGFCLLVYKHIKGGSSASGVYLPVSQAEMEMQAQGGSRGGSSSITPDVVRIG